MRSTGVGDKHAGALASAMGAERRTSGKLGQMGAPPRYKYARASPGCPSAPHFTDLPIHTQWVLELLQPPVSPPHTGTSSTPTGSGTTTRGTLRHFYKPYRCLHYCRIIYLNFWILLLYVALVQNISLFFDKFLLGSLRRLRMDTMEA